MLAWCYENFLSVSELLHTDRAALIENVSVTVTTTANVTTVVALQVNTFAPIEVELVSFYPSHDLLHYSEMLFLQVEILLLRILPSWSQYSHVSCLLVLPCILLVILPILSILGMALLITIFYICAIPGKTYPTWPIDNSNVVIVYISRILIITLFHSIYKAQYDVAAAESDDR